MATTKITIDTIDDETVAELMNILCKQVFHRRLKDVKEKVIKRPAMAVLSLSDVMKAMDLYGVKYTLIVEYDKTTVKDEPLPLGDEGMEVSIVEKNMAEQEQAIVNEEVKSVVEEVKASPYPLVSGNGSTGGAKLKDEAFPEPPDFIF